MSSLPTLYTISGDLLARFKLTKVETVVDKTAVKKAIVAGEDVPGAHLNDNYNLQIK